MKGFYTGYVGIRVLGFRVCLLVFEGLEVVVLRLGVFTLGVLGFGAYEVRIQCARGGRAFYFRNRVHPLIARLRPHVVPPQPPQLFSIRV